MLLRGGEIRLAQPLLPGDLLRLVKETRGAAEGELGGGVVPLPEEPLALLFAVTALAELFPGGLLRVEAIRLDPSERGAQAQVLGGLARLPLGGLARPRRSGGSYRRRLEPAGRARQADGHGSRRRDRELRDRPLRRNGPPARGTRCEREAGGAPRTRIAHPRFAAELPDDQERPYRQPGGGRQRGRGTRPRRGPDPQ